MSDDGQPLPPARTSRGATPPLRAGSAKVSSRRFVRSLVTALVVAWSLRVCWLVWGYYLARPIYRRHLLESSTMILVAAGLLLVLTRRAPIEATDAPSPPPGKFTRRLTGPWHSPLLIGLMMTGLAVALYWPALDVGFLSDDFVLSGWAREGRFVRHAETGLFRPVPLAVWAAVFATVGVSPALLHLLNVVLHASNATLVCSLAMTLGLPPAPAVVAGLLFLAFPAAAEAVVWCSGIQDVLMTTCALGAVLACRRSASRPAWMLVAALCAVLGLGVKETAVIVPVLCAITLAGTPTLRYGRTQWLLASLFAFSTAYVIGRTASGVPSTYWRVPTRYFIKELIVQPFATLAAPWRADTLVAYPAIGIVGGTVLLALLMVCLIVWTRRDGRFHAASKMALWSLAGVVPVYAYLHITGTLEGSRYIYLSAAGWVVTLVAMAVTAGEVVPSGSSRAAGTTLAAVVLITWASGLRHEIGIWREAGALREAALRSVASAARDRDCARVSLIDAPDSLHGVFVFRNGLAQALASRGLPPMGTPGTVVPGCVLRWAGQGFVATPAAEAGGSRR